MKNLPSNKSELKMQKGLATLEIILAVMIIAVLASTAVPNAVRIIDRAALDYETKRLYSELRFVQSISKASTISNTGTGGNNNVIKSDGKIIKRDETAVFLTILDAKNGYQVFRGNTKNKKALREPHYLANGITISFPKNTITFNELGSATDISGAVLSNTLTLTSRLNKKNYITFDSVGRIHASLDDK